MQPVSVARAELKPMASIPQEEPPRRPRLIAKWQKQDGKLFCQWISVE